MSSNIAGHILVVDDQPNWRQALRILLNEEGYQVSEAESFEQACDLLSESVFDVIVIDVRLVDEDIFNVEGLALLNLAKETHPSSRVIVLTGYPDSVKGKLEADALVFKVPPGSTFDTKGFKSLVRDLVQEATANQAHGEAA